MTGDVILTIIPIACRLIYTAMGSVAYREGPDWSVAPNIHRWASNSKICIERQLWVGRWWASNKGISNKLAPGHPKLSERHWLIERPWSADYLGWTSLQSGQSHVCSTKVLPAHRTISCVLHQESPCIRDNLIFALPTIHVSTQTKLRWLKYMSKNYLINDNIEANFVL